MSNIHRNSNIQSFINDLLEYIPEHFNINTYKIDKISTSYVTSIYLTSGYCLWIKKSEEPKFINIRVVNEEHDEVVETFKYSWSYTPCYKNELIDKHLIPYFSTNKKESNMINPHKLNNTYVTGKEVIELVKQGVNVKASYKLNKNVVDASSLPLIEFVTNNSNFEFYIPPNYIKIGDIEVPRPLDYLPLPNVTVYYPNPFVTELVGQTNAVNLDKTKIKQNVYHLTKESAMIHAQALVLISGGTVSI